MSDNRHPREPDVKVEVHEELGFVINIKDGKHSVQVKPHPSGYQIDGWLADENGERHQTATHLPAPMGRNVEYDVLKSGGDPYDDLEHDELYELAKARGVEGRSIMTDNMLREELRLR